MSNNIKIDNLSYKMVVEMSKNAKIDTNCIEFEYTINII